MAFMKRNLIAIGSSLVGDTQRGASFEKALKEIQDFRLLPNNWDTYGGKPARERATSFCEALLQDLRVQSDVAPPRVRPISTGAYLEWQKNGEKLYLEVDEDSVLVVQTSEDAERFSTEDSDFDVREAARLVQAFHNKSYADH
jgi:hypothetical protein